MKLRLRPLLFFIAIIALGVLITTRLGQLESLINTIKGVNLWLLLLVIPLRYIYYWANTLYFRKFFEMFDNHIEHKHLFRTVVATNFINIIIPSAGVSGLSYMRETIGKKVKSSILTLSHLGYYMLGLVAGLVLFVSSFAMLLLSNQVVRVSSRLILLTMFVFLVFVVIALVMLVNRRLSVDTIILLSRPVNWMLHKLHRRPITRPRVEDFLDDAGDNLNYIRQNWRMLMKPFLALFLMLLIDILSLYVVAASFGQILNPAVVISSYCLAQIGSLASVLTAGVGAFEAVLAASLVGFGVPFDVAFSITIVYRGIAFWAFLPVGLWYYKRGVIDGK